MISGKGGGGGGGEVRPILFVIIFSLSYRAFSLVEVFSNVSAFIKIEKINLN